MKSFATLFFFSAHILFVLVLWIQPHFTKPPTHKKPLTLNTIAKRPPSAKKNPPLTQQAAKRTLPAPSEPPAAKKTTPPKAQAPVKTAMKEPAIADKVIATKKKSTPSPPSPPRAKLSQSLLKEIEETLSKIEQKNPASPIAAPKHSPLNLEIDASDNDTASFAETLIFFLQDALTLPEYGEVKIQLDLREDGSVDKLTVLSSHSRANKRYLEEHLPQLKLPRPQGDPRFILTFANKV